MNKNKVFDTLDEINITIGRSSNATKLFEFHRGKNESDLNNGIERPCFQVDDIIADNTSYDEGVVVSVDFSSPTEENVHISEEFDWDEDHEIERFMERIVENFGLTEEELRFMFKFCELHLPEAKVMKVFKYPVEEMLTHSNEAARREGLSIVHDKTD